MSYTWAGVTAAAVLASLPLVPRTVRACTCPASSATVVWPRDGATDVARDTPLVISPYDWSDVPVSFGYALVRADGSEIAITERDRLPAAFEGCGSSDTVFLRPSELLDEGAEYTLSVSGLPPENRKPRATFTAGAGTFTPEPLQDLEIDYLHVEGTTPCSSANCGIAQLRVDFGAPVQEPRWLMVESAAVKHGRNALQFFPEAWSPSPSDFNRDWRLSVELPAGDRCVQVRLYGLDGAMLLDERPSKTSIARANPEHARGRAHRGRDRARLTTRTDVLPAGAALSFINPNASAPGVNRSGCSSERGATLQVA